MTGDLLTNVYTGERATVTHVFTYEHKPAIGVQYEGDSRTYYGYPDHFTEYQPGFRPVSNACAAIGSLKLADHQITDLGISGVLDEYTARSVRGQIAHAMFHMRERATCMDQDTPDAGTHLN